jgi:hypothetical protein
MCPILLVISSLIAFSDDVNLRWKPNIEVDVVGYRMHYGVNSRSYTNVQNVGSVTNFTVTGLQRNTTYYFAVTCFNASGLESVYSNEVTYTPKESVYTFKNFTIQFP